MVQGRVSSQLGFIKLVKVLLKVYRGFMSHLWLANTYVQCYYDIGFMGLMDIFSKNYNIIIEYKIFRLAQ